MNDTNPSDSTTSRSDTPTSAETKRPKRFKRGIVLGVVVVLLGAGGLLLRTQVQGDENENIGPTAEVKRGGMIVSVTESGELESERRKVISNKLRWPAIIKEVVEEGTRVQKGQVIIEFECKELLEAIEQAELEVTSAKNNYTQAEQNLQLKQEEMDNLVLKAKRTLQEAKENEKLYIDHESPITQYDKESQVQLAKEDVRLAEKTLNFMLEVNKRPKLESPYSKSEIETNKLKVERLKNALRKAELDLDKLKKYDHKRRLRELSEAIEDNALALKRSELEARGQLLMAEANLQATKRQYEMHKKRLEDLRKDEKKLIVRAKDEGLVVYSTGRSEVVVEKGEKINPQQQLMVIPDMSTLEVHTRVYEAMIDKVKVGLPAVIRMDAKPEESYPGVISKVSVLPSSQNRWLNPNLKVFGVTVKFDKRPPDLKPGMTCKVEMMLAKLDDVLSVPVAAVFSEQETTHCWRVTEDGVESVDVKLGQMTDQRVEILTGLKKGDVVLLAPPNDNQNPSSSSSPPNG